jgi:hypothetical protein
MLNCRKKGLERDKLIIDNIGYYEVLNTEQIYSLLFTPGKYGQVKTRERLRKLVELKRIIRGRVDLNQPAYYYISKKPALLDHMLQLNWGYIYLWSKTKSWEVFNKLENEYALGPLQADGFCGFINTKGENNRYYFIESDMSGSRNKFKKISLYNDLFESGICDHESWAEFTSKFPSILIVTDSERKLNIISEIIKSENRNRLNFEVITVDQIRETFLQNNSSISNSTVSYKGI